MDQITVFCFRMTQLHSLSDTTLWHGLRKTGDGHRTGTPISASFTEKLLDHLSLGDHELEAFPLHVKSDKAKESQYLTRLHLMNELFNVFLNRACSFDTTVPLVLGHCQVAQPLTHLFEKFREQLGRVTATGDTAVYDALDVARLQLVQYRTDLPHLRRRIIIVSDGKDTSSKQSVLEVLAGLQRDSIIVDSVQVGPTVDPALHGISVVTGGYRFCPRTSLSDALSIFDLETVLNSAERPIQIQKRIFVATKRALIGTYGDTSIYPIDVVTLDKFPKRAEHPALFEKVKPLQLINVTGRGKDDRMKRIMREAQNLLKKPAPYMDLYFDESNMTFLRIVMEAPKDKDCLYRNGVYLLTCDFLEGYPREPPQIRFTNFIMHPNVSKQGKVCIAELGRLWSSDMSMEMALQLVYQIFSHPDLENPVETQASMRYCMLLQWLRQSKPMHQKQEQSGEQSWKISHRVIQITVGCCDPGCLKGSWFL
ncbi:hypothetical protein BDP27DRAFT_1370544 [Rhodocollybia butyracea]|uniref:UBC core domain-containing protein n=1 Tax=Rhodocollybia butyracea TaxID=206335 RepID=A0A9P5TZJ2_9AGAR|nr:hypothetical protein BDP27DRAFT_1370544 [Rhodocollybia butyracea]